MSGRAVLLFVPIELLLSIADCLQRQDILSLSLVCRVLRSALEEQLWRDLVVRPRSHRSVHRISTKIPRGIPLRHVRGLHFRSDFQGLPGLRCIHWDPLPTNTGRNKFLPHHLRYNWPRMDKLMGRVSVIILRFKIGQLQRFSWDLGTCLPERLLPLLKFAQYRLRSIKLTTDGHCTGAGRFARPFDVEFPQLQELSWTAPGNLSLLSGFFLSHASQLREIDFNWTSDALLWDHLTTFPGQSTDKRLRPVPDVASESPPASCFLLPSIQVVCLSRVVASPTLLSRVLNIGNLQSLTFRDCIGWSEVVLGAFRETKSLRLRTLEIQSSLEIWHQTDDGKTDWSWLPFLDSIQGLEELFISLKVELPVSAYGLWQHVAEHHQATLTKFVHHYREISDIVWGQDSCDMDALGLEDDLPNIAYNPFVWLDLECFGLPCDPIHLKSILGPFTTKRSLRFLHIRQTKLDWAELGSRALRSSPSNPDTSDIDTDRHLEHSDLDEDFFAFIKWAFGPGGIGSLETVAFGDFAYGRTTPGHNFLLVRDEDSEGGFRIVSVRDSEGKSIVSEHRRVLESCPIVPEDPAPKDESEYVRSMFGGSQFGEDGPSTEEKDELEDTADGEAQDQDMEGERSNDEELDSEESDDEDTRTKKWTTRK